MEKTDKKTIAELVDTLEKENIRMKKEIIHIKQILAGIVEKL